MTDAEYQLWRNGIHYVKRLLGIFDHDEFSESHLMAPFGVCTFFSSISLLFLLCIFSCDDIQIWWPFQGVAGPTTGVPIDPPRLPWSAYPYGPNGFARERPVGRNSNLMGYLFP